MSSRPPQIVATLLTSADGRLRTLLQHARYLQRLNDRLYDILPARLKSHVALANVTKTSVILCAESSAWATQVHFHVSELLEALKEDLPGITDIKIKTARPMSPDRKRLAARQPRISATTKRCLSTCADGIEDPGLRKALRRVAERGE